MADPITIAQAKRASEDASYMKKTVESLNYSEVTPDGVDKRTISGMNIDVNNAIERVDDAIDALDSEVVTDLEAASLAAGTTYENITYSTNLVDEIKGYIFDADTQITYAVPEAAQGKFIGSVVGSVLTTTDTSEYELIPVIIINLNTTLNAILSVDLLQEGTTVVTSGYSELGDGGGSKFVVTDAIIPNTFYKAGSSKYLTYVDTPTIKQFGCAGDWNSNTQEGTDDTDMFQSYIDILSTHSVRRSGGVTQVLCGHGNFRVGAVTLPASLGYGMVIMGDGIDACTIWNDETWDCEIESLTFKELTAFNSLSEDGSEATWGDGFIECDRPNKAQDIDLTLDSVKYGYSSAWAKVHGRGFVVKGASIGVYCRRVLEIVCDTDAVFSGDKNDTLKTGMRHYTFIGMRTDNVREILGSSGDGLQRKFINSIQMLGNDFASCQRLINDTEIGIKKAVINNNISSNSFQNSVMNINRFNGLTMLGNDFSPDEDYEETPSSALDSIQWVMFTRDTNKNLNFSNNNIRGVTRGAFRFIGGTGSHKNIKIQENNFYDYSDYDDGTNTIYFTDSDIPIEQLSLLGNGVVSDISSTRNYEWFTGVDLTTLVFDNNNTTFNFREFDYTPIVYAGELPVVTQPATYSAEYAVSNGYCDVALTFNVDLDSEIGDLSVSLPIVAQPKAPSVTGGYSGGGMWIDWDGITLPENQTIIGCYVDAEKQRVLINTQLLGTTPLLNCTAGSSLTRLRLEFRYKI